MANGLTATYNASHRFDELRRVVTDSVFEYGLNVLDVFDVFGWITFDYDQVCLLAWGDRADAVELSQKLRAICGRDVDRLDWSESCFDQQFDFALIAET